MIRIVEFKDGLRWIARFRMPPIDPDDEDGEGSVLLQREVDCIQLVKERTTMPVPVVYGYRASINDDIGAPFILMECLAGNVASDLNSSSTQPQHKLRFYVDMARYQVSYTVLEMSWDLDLRPNIYKCSQ